MLISWRRPANDHGVCLPCAACTTCLCLLSVPPTLCFGMLYAMFKSKAQAVSEAAAAVSKRRSAGAATSQLSAGHSDCVVGASGMTLEHERRVWLLVLWSLFGDSGLRDIGPLIWRFLDDHPCFLRVVDQLGTVQDLPLRGQRGRRRPDVAHRVDRRFDTVLGFLHGRVAVSSGQSFLLAEVGEERRGRLEHLCMPGHRGDVTCFASDGADHVATGSTDLAVRVWRDGQCVRTLVGQEWSEWTGTMYIGHVAPITALLFSPDGRVLSGDEHGAVCRWNEDGGCSMLDPPAGGAVTCLVRGPDDGFLVGHQEGIVAAASWALEKGAVWKGAGEQLLAVAVESGCDRIMAASTTGFSQASLYRGVFFKLAKFPSEVSAVQFQGTILLACSEETVSLWAFNGRLLASVDLQDARAACLLYRADLEREEARRRLTADAGVGDGTARAAF